MRAFLILMVAGVSAARGGEAKELRYLRLDDGQWVTESTVTRPRGRDGVYVSVTERAAEKMTLTIRKDSEGRLLGAEALQETKQGKKRVSLTMRGKWALLKRPGGVTEQFMLPADAVVTTAPDWSDIFEVLRRYDRGRGGKQEFHGVWIHPVQPPRVLTFTAEQLGEDVIAVKDEKTKLGHYRVGLRSGAYLVWADTAGLVHKLMPADRPAGAVVLEGFEEATRTLR